VAAAACAAVAIGAGLAEAVTGSAGPAEPRITLDRIDPVLPEHLAANLFPGHTRSGCLTVGHASGGPLHVGVFATRLAGDLAPYLRLTVRRGRPTIAPGSCAGFAPDATLYDGRLSDLPGDAASAVPDPRALGVGERSAYRFELTLEDDDDARGRRVNWDFGFVALAVAVAGPGAEPRPTVERPSAERPSAPQGTPPAVVAPEGPQVPGTSAASDPLAGPAAGSPCQSLALPPGRRSVRKPLKLGSSQPTRATLTLRGSRLILTAGGRAQHSRRGSGRWRTVTYAIAAGASLKARRPPFRVRVAPQQLAGGANAVRVSVTSLRHAARSGTVTITAEPGPAGRCTLR